jgi:hypothetical protein
MDDDGLKVVVDFYTEEDRCGLCSELVTDEKAETELYGSTVHRTCVNEKFMSDNKVY